MKVVVATDSFKGSMRSDEAGSIIADALRESLKDEGVLDLVKVTKTEVWDVENAVDWQPKRWTAISSRTRLLSPMSARYTKPSATAMSSMSTARRSVTATAARAAPEVSRPWSTTS